MGYKGSVEVEDFRETTALLHEADQAVTPPGSHLTYATRTVWGMPWWVMRFNARQRTPASVAC